MLLCARDTGLQQGHSLPGRVAPQAAFLYAGMQQAPRHPLLPCPAGKLAEVLRVSDTFLEAWSKAGFATTFLSNRQNAQDLAAFFLSLDCCLQGMVLATVQLQGRDGRPFKVGVQQAVSTRCWSPGTQYRSGRPQGISCLQADPNRACILLQGSVMLLRPVRVTGQAGWGAGNARWCALHPAAALNTGLAC